MKLIGQRWEYRIGNHLVHVDNAYSASGWSQERLVVNLETVQERGGWFHFLRLFAEPWLTPLGHDSLKVTLRSGVMRINCSVEVGGAQLDAERTLGSEWYGPARSWPTEEGWR